jgi:hypothetical protein
VREHTAHTTKCGENPSETKLKLNQIYEINIKSSTNEKREKATLKKIKYIRKFINLFE